MKLSDIPILPGYIGVARAAKILGISRVSVYYMIYDMDAFKNVFKVESRDGDTRPMILMAEAEVRRVAAEKAEKASTPSEAPLRDRITVWNKRVKKWGVETGWDKTSGVRINQAGQPHHDLKAAYLAAHPGDPRPE